MTAYARFTLTLIESLRLKSRTGGSSRKGGAIHVLGHRHGGRDGRLPRPLLCENLVIFV